jgi:hypothetical protein
MREKSEVNWGSLLVSKYSLEQRYIFLCREGRDTDSIIITTRGIQLL